MRTTGNGERSATFPFPFSMLHSIHVPIVEVRHVGINNQQLLKFVSGHRVKPFDLISLSVLRSIDDAIKATEIGRTFYLMMLTLLTNI